MGKIQAKVNKQIYKQLKRLGDITDGAVALMKTKQMFALRDIAELREVSEEMTALAHFLLKNERY